MDLSRVTLLLTGSSITTRQINPHQRTPIFLRRTIGRYTDTHIMYIVHTEDCLIYRIELFHVHYKYQTNSTITFVTSLRNELPNSYHAGDPANSFYNTIQRAITFFKLFIFKSILKNSMFLHRWEDFSQYIYQMGRRWKIKVN